MEEIKKGVGDAFESVKAECRGIPLEKACRWLKGISIACIAIGGLSTLGGIAALAAGIRWGGNLIAMALGLIVLVIGAADLAMGALGYRGASDPSRIGGFYSLSKAILWLNVASLALGILTGSAGAASLPSLAMAAGCTALAYSISENAGKALPGEKG